MGSPFSFRFLLRLTRPTRLGSILLALAGLAALLGACGRVAMDGPTPSTVDGSPRSRSDALQPGSDGSAARRGLKVVTTFLPITLLTRSVAGDCAEVRALVPPSTGPHDFQAKPGDLLALRQARVLVKNGLGVESFLDALITSAENPQLVVIDSSRGVRVIGANPHIWLDPLRAAQQVATIGEGLAKADPGCAAGYRRRAAATTAQLRQLNADLARQLRPFQGKTFVAFHDVAPYFAERYGLKAQFLVDVPEINPTPADLQRVAEVVKATQLRAVLSEPQAAARSFNALAEDLGVPIGLFDPLETGSEEASKDPATYFATMRRNGANLVKAFGG
jgi:zinc/manganese transport system substrate-binding protein